MAVWLLLMDVDGEKTPKTRLECLEGCRPLAAGSLLVHDYSPAEFRNNVIGLAKLGKVFKLPTVLTTSLGQAPNGPFIPEVVSMFPDVPVIDRPGIISAWDDPKFVAAVEKTGRKNQIMAGVTVDVCLAFAAMQAVDAGYNVYGVVDASGGLEVTATVFPDSLVQGS